MGVERIAYLEGTVETPRGAQRVWRERVATLTLTSGTLVVRDALIPDRFELRRTVAPGEYPFILTLTLMPGEDEPRPAAAMVAFAELPVTRWEPARRWKRGWWLHRSITDAKIPIDSWHLGVMDADANRAYDAFVSRLPRDRNLLAEEHEANDGLWNERRFADTPANVVTCFSGLGSGAYPAYWGLDPGGEAVCLVVDFEIFEDDQYEGGDAV